jgi:hypothetical protein
MAEGNSGDGFSLSRKGYPVILGAGTSCYEKADLK